jgi:hypothetical protein
MSASGRSVGVHGRLFDQVSLPIRFAFEFKRFFTLFGAVRGFAGVQD